MMKFPVVLELIMVLAVINEEVKNYLKSRLEVDPDLNKGDFTNVFS